jgi:hypothetical protein
VDRATSIADCVYFDLYKRALSYIYATSIDTGGDMVYFHTMLERRFRLRTDTIAIVVQDGKKVAFRIPAGAEILLIDRIPDPLVDPTQVVNATWEGKMLTLFAADIRDRGERILKKGR